MFGINRRNEHAKYDEPIDKVLDELREYSVDASEFAAAMDYLDRLTKMKVLTSQDRVSPDTMAMVLGNLFGILVIVAYEQRHVMTSKAMGFILRAK